MFLFGRAGDRILSDGFRMKSLCEDNGDCAGQASRKKGYQRIMYMVTVNKEKCDGDGNCANVCPQAVFELDGGKAEPVNMSECINCNTCVENCPQEAIAVTEL